MRTACCLSLSPPTTSNKASLNNSTKPPQISLTKNEGCWRRQCVLIGVTSYCTIIGLEMNNSVTLAHEFVTKEGIMAMPTVDEVQVVNGGAKWSEKRACPSWHGNSLETIVPENLPRPAARRRYESVRSTSKAAPPLSVPAKATRNMGGCFSM